VGNLKAVWTDLPDDLEDEDMVKTEFYRVFGGRWDNVLLGSEKPFDHHRYWDGYLAVTELQQSRGLTLSDLPLLDPSGKKVFRYNIVIG